MNKHTSKRIAHVSSAVLLSLCLSSAAFASDADQKLTADNTTAILQKMNNIPAYLSAIGQYVIAWMAPDDSDATGAMQGNFTTLGNLLIQDTATQNTLQSQLNTDLLAGTTKTTLPYANDLVYSSILGAPFYNPDPRGASMVPQYNYIKNASGLTLNQVTPNPAWQGSKEAQLKYIHYYNTVMAIKSYNAYILSHQYADGKQFNDLQTTLITQASDPTAWFANVASENIGWVLRQMLMYQSQSFVLLSELVKTERQMLTAQAMTNAAVIAVGSINDNTIVHSAQTSS